MKKGLFLLAIFGIVLTSCSNDDDSTSNPDPGPTTVALESEQISNLFAPVAGGGQGQSDEGAFTKFDFETGMITTSETDWDIAFRGTAIAVNGGNSTNTIGEPERTGDAGAFIETGIFSEVTSAEGLKFTQDAAEGYAIKKANNEGWYNYNFMTNVVSPIPGKIIVLKTRDGNYAKVEILSYYENAPANPDPQSDASRNYSFNYVYNPNQGDTAL